MRVRLGFLVAFCAGMVALAAQDPPPGDTQPTFTAGVRYVRIDLYAMRDGRLIDDLRLDEIELYEDDVPQAIETIERVDFREPDPFEPASDPRTLDESRRAAADPRTRVFVVFLDRWHTEYLSPGWTDTGPVVQRRFPLLGELERVLGPDDLVGVMTYDMRPEDLTFVRGLAGLAGLEGTWERYSVIRPDPGGDFDAQEELYQACYPLPPGNWDPRDSAALASRMILRRRERMTLDALESLSAYLGQLREERKAVLVVTDGWRIYTPDDGMLERRADDVAPRVPLDGRPDPDRTLVLTERGASQLTDRQREVCEADRTALAALSHTDRVQQIARRANRSNVSFYPVSPAGLTAERPAPGSSTRTAVFENRSPFEMQTTLRILAEETDGIPVLNTNGVAGGVARIVADTSAYYLLGYTSTNTALDGRYRRITVRVNRPGVSVRARPGYTAPTASDVERLSRAAPAVPPAEDPVADALAALASAGDRASVHLRATAWNDGAGGAFLLVGEVDEQVRRSAAWSRGGTAEISILAPDADASMSRTVDLTSAGAAFEVRVPETGTVASGTYAVQVRVSGAGAPLTQTLVVHVPPERQALGEPLFRRRGPSTGVAYVPTADPRLRRNERLRLELPAASPAVATARLLDRNGAPLAVPARVTDREDAGSQRWIVVDLTLAPLSPGDYAIEVVQEAERRAAAFRLVP